MRKIVMTQRLPCPWVWLILPLTLLSLTVSTVAPQAPTPAGIAQQIQQGAMTLTLRVDRQTIGVVEPFHVTLALEAPAASIVVFPEPGASLGPFQVVRILPKKSKATGAQRQQWQQEYRLIAEQPGTFPIPALSVQVRSGEDAISLSTQPVSMTVTSLLPEDADVKALKDIAPPVLLVRRGVPPWVWFALAGLAGVALVLAAWWLWRRRLPPALPPRPAHLLALEALQHLQRDDLIAQWRIEEFYVRLSGILRRYVEWRFGMRAPEQTSEEFLEAVFTTGGLIAAHRDLLAAFLQQCDLVKFALHRPLSGDMQRALESARAFIEQTADAAVCVAVPADQESAACA